MKERTNHKWEVFDEKAMIYKCKHCGNFMRKRAFTGNTDATIVRESSGKVINLVGHFIQRYSLKGSSKWIDEMPECKMLQ
jgi:hypothetical protein